MVELIFIVVLLLSLVGLTTILWRKMPALCKLPERDFNFGNSLTGGIKSGIKKIPGIENFHYELYLQKVLSRIRVLTMKTENKTGNWLERLRQKNCEKHQTNNDNYWDELRKAKNGK